MNRRFLSLDAGDRASNRLGGANHFPLSSHQVRNPVLFDLQYIITLFISLNRNTITIEHEQDERRLHQLRPH